MTDTPEDGIEVIPWLDTIEAIAAYSKHLLAKSEHDDYIDTGDCLDVLRAVAALGPESPTESAQERLDRRYGPDTFTADPEPDVDTDLLPACKITLSAVLTGDREGALETFMELLSDSDFVGTAVVTEHASQADAEVDPFISVDPDMFRNHYDAESELDPGPRAVVDNATDLDIAAALEYGFNGDFWWATFDNCCHEALCALVRQANGIDELGNPTS